MANRHRGEIDAELDGRTYRLCLTLGALAELETSFGDDDMLALASRFERGSLSARDAIRIIGAGLRGAGNDVSDAQVEAMRTDGGAAGFVAIVAGLLQATFAGGDEQAAAGRDTTRGASLGDKGAGAGASAPAPFPGRT